MGRGTSKAGGVTAKAEPIKTGGSVAQFEKYTQGLDFQARNDMLREDFGLENASEEQLNAVKDIMRGVMQYDKGYDEAKTPYVINSFDLYMVGEGKDAPVAFHLRATSKSDSAMIRIMDEKEHNALIGRRGGLFEYATNSKTGKIKHKKLDDFKVKYGTRTF